MGNWDNSYVMIPVGVPIYWCLVMMPHFARVRATSAEKGFVNTNGDPRLAVKNSMEGDTKTAGFVRRATGAHQNGWENFTVFLSACVAALLGKVDHEFVNVAIIFILVLRLMYNVFYLVVSEGPASYLRSFCFLSAMGLTWAIWVKACIEVF